MKRSPNLVLVLSLALVLILSAGCSGGPGGSPSSQEPAPSSSGAFQPAGDLLAQLDDLWSQLDTSRIPCREGRSYDEFSPGVMPEGLPVQTLYPEDADAYQLALQIRNVTYFGQNIIQDFDSIDSCYLPALLQTALYHTMPLDLGDYTYDSATGAAEFPDYPNHVISALMREQFADGRYPSEAFAAEDVRATMTLLFGKDVTPIDMDLSPYYYFKRGDVYLRMGDFGGPMWPYAQITDYQKTENGYVCEAVLVSALDDKEPLSVYSDDGQVLLTADNFEEATASLNKYRYTFTWEGDRLVLSGLKTLRGTTPYLQ